MFIKASFTSALRQPCTYLRRQISWFRTAASRCSILHRKTAVRNTRSQGCRNEFSTCSFSLRFVCVFWETYDSRKTHKAVARLLQYTQGVRTTDVIVRKPRICFTSAARLPQGNRALYRKAVARMPRNVRLQCGTCTTYRFVLRQSCNFCMAVLRQPFVWREITVRTSYVCLTLDVILCDIVCDLPHGLYVLSPTTKTHDQTVVRLMWIRLYSTCDEWTFPSAYHLDESTFIFRGIRSNFSFLFHFSMKIKTANRIAPDRTPRFVASHLGLFCLPMSNKKEVFVKSVSSALNRSTSTTCFEISNICVGCRFYTWKPAIYYKSRSVYCRLHVTRVVKLPEHRTSNSPLQRRILLIGSIPRLP